MHHLRAAKTQITHTPNQGNAPLDTIALPRPSLALNLHAQWEHTIHTHVLLNKVNVPHVKPESIVQQWDCQRQVVIAKQDSIATMDHIPQRQTAH